MVSKEAGGAHLFASTGVQSDRLVLDGILGAGGFFHSRRYIVLTV